MRKYGKFIQSIQILSPTSMCQTLQTQTTCYFYCKIVIFVVVPKYCQNVYQKILGYTVLF